LGSLLNSPKTTGSAGGDETDLSTGGSGTSDGRRHTNVLVVTSSVGMLHGVLGYTTNLGPAVALDGILVVGTSGLQQWLVGTTSSGDDTNLGTDGGGDGLLSSGWKSELGGSLFLVVGDDNGIGTRGTGKGTTVTTLGFDVANDGSLGHRVQGEDVSAGQGRLLSAVNELSGVHTLGTEEQFVVLLVSVGVVELDLADGGSSTGVVNDLLDGSLDVTLLLGKVERSELDGSLAGAGVRLEDGGLTLSLCLNVFTHVDIVSRNYKSTR